MMLLIKKITGVLLLLFLLASVSSGQSGSVNPYDILGKHFEAIGGLERMRAEKSYYFVGDMVIGSLSGTLAYWEQRPGYMRLELDLGIFNITQGETPEYEWVLDSNGKLQKITNFDESTIKRKKLNLLYDEYAYADHNLKTFTVKYNGTAKVDDKNCHVIEITNSINVDRLTLFINAENYLLDKSIAIEADESNDTYYGDYRDVDGLMVAFSNKVLHHQSNQEEELTITKYESNPKLDLSLFEAPGESVKDYHFTDGDAAVDIPVRFVENHIYVPVTIDCKQTIWVLDTGAAVTVIDKTFAEELGIELEGGMKAVGAGGQVDIQFAKIPSLSVKGVAIDGQTVAVIDISEINLSVPIPIAGILGFDFLSRFVTKVDYANEKLSLYEPEKFEYTGDGNEVNLHLHNGVFTVEASLENKYSGSWLFDLGASGCSLDDVYAHVNNLGQRKGVDGIGQGAGNYFYYTSVKFDEMEFAGYKVNNLKASFNPDVTDTLFTQDEIGTLGNNLFRNFVIYCDYAREKLYVEKGAKFNGAFPEDRSGLRLQRNGEGYFKLIFIPENTPAYKAKFKVGDVICRINGIDVKLFDDIKAVRDLFTEKPGTKYTIDIVRDGKEKTLKLTLKDLYE